MLYKLIQRKTYDVLSKKNTILLIFVGFVILFISTLHFGETLLEWSKEKYSVVFSPYTNNILNKNYRSMLCQYVPIDVVYTWVNGSDPLFLKELMKAKQEYSFLGYNDNCTFSNCIKSHMVLVRPQLPCSVTGSDLEGVDPVFASVADTFVVTSQLEGNITVLEFPNIGTADLALSIKEISLNGQNYSISTAYVTDKRDIPHAVPLNRVALITQLPSGHSESNILKSLPNHLQSSVSKVFIREEKGLAILSLSTSKSPNSLRSTNITFDSKVSFLTSAYLVTKLPMDHEDVSASRFIDNEELRYSLRSLESHAPWVQHVYIITNGQIPYWINLDNPQLTIVTHEEIFPNKSHLPTFNSPAIECHLHRIPNLSKKFIYLNDDVMFGKEVWPEDFYTHTKGQKVYLSWPVPNCAEGCPSSWIRDGYCDKPCNNTQCQWDGGDCSSSDNPMLHLQGAQEGGGMTNFFHSKATKNYCNNECADTWLADRYCDKACNVKECGYDAGDCGVEQFSSLREIVLDERAQYFLPQGEIAGYFNLSHLMQSNYTVAEGLYEENPAVRTLAISLKHSVVGIVLYPNQNATNITFSLKGEFLKEPFEKKIQLHVDTRPLKAAAAEIEDHKSSTTAEAFTFEQYEKGIRFPQILTTASRGIPFLEPLHLNLSALEVSENLTKEFKSLDTLKDAGILTDKGFLTKKAELIHRLMQDLNITLENLPLIAAAPVSEKEGTIISASRQNTSHEANSLVRKEIQLPFAPPAVAPEREYSSQASVLSSNDAVKREESRGRLLPKSLDSKASLKNYFVQLSHFRRRADPVPFPRTNASPTQRHLLDTFGDSLRHVNKLYNEAFGYETRKVPSHIAHFVDKSVMYRLTERFDNAFQTTSSHKIRSSQDMQFAFSYYYYLMSEMESVQVAEIFDSFDTDKSGTWSDREMRTVLTRLFDLPLAFSSVAGFEQLLINCSLSTSMPLAEEAFTSHEEHYYESKLPVITKSLILSCPPVTELLLQRFGSRKRNAYEILGEEEVAFKMIHNNLTQVLTQIDDLRKHPKKFVCLNDNMDHSTPESEVIRAVIQDFYESLFPERSQFELPPEYHNRFAYIWELSEWRRTRDIVRFVTYSTLGILILFSIYSFWKSEMKTNEKYSRLKTIQAKNKNSQSV